MAASAKRFGLAGTRRLPNKRRTLLVVGWGVTVVAAAALALAITLIVGRTPPGHARREAQPGRSKGTVGSSALACGAGQNPVYYVSQSGAAGSSANTSAAAFGHARASILSTSPGQSTLLVACDRPGETGPPGTGYLPVYPQSSDPALCSLEYTLSDRPAAQPLLASARSAVISAGMASSSAIAGPGTTYLVSDDPLDSSEVIVAIIVDAGRAGTTPTGQPLEKSQWLLTFVNRSTAQATAVAYGPTQG